MSTNTMQAWTVTQPGPIEGNPLTLTERPIPEAGSGQVLLRVLTCGVCHTDLHVAEADLPLQREHVIPGHEIVGEVVALGQDAHRFAIGDRVGAAWLASTCGVCWACRSGRENLCPESTYTGWDIDGGYAEYVAIHEGYGYRLPEGFDDATAAPLLCAGIIGYRALKRANVPPGGRLALYGFGGSAHLAAQVAIAAGIEVHVFTRGADVQDFARTLGAASAQGFLDAPPVPMDSAISFAPVGTVVPTALAALKPGGTLALAGIHVSDIPVLNYQNAIFHEKTLTSVESNTRRDGEEFLNLASRLSVHPTVTELPLENAQRALTRLKKGDIQGAMVLRIAARHS